MRLALIALALAAAGPAAAQETQLERGHDLLAESCGGCHAVEQTGDSPLAIAPPFRTLHLRYPVQDLEESLAEGIMSGHPEMPEFAFEPDDVSAIIVYLESLK